jgi:Flp pilus assembly CpaE family ATPase
VLITYWAAKGGSGTTVVAAAHALRAAADGPALLVDLAGDLPRVLDVPEPAAGVADWLAAGAQVPTDALDRIATTATTNLRLLGRGCGPLDDRRADVLAHLLAGMPRTVVVDCGTRPGPVGRTVARAADRSVLVTRACYVAIRRQLDHELAPTEITLVRESQRSLKTADITAALGVPVRTSIPFDPAISRAVDAGLLRSRLPRALARRVALDDPAPRRQVARRQVAPR